MPGRLSAPAFLPDNGTTGELWEKKSFCPSFRVLLCPFPLWNPANID
jgi:hypothetical protein